MSELVWILVGFGFGVMFMINLKEHRVMKTYEELDEALRNDLALHKNLVASLKVDLAFAKKKLASKEHQNDPSLEHR